jgi:hypothetical protein
VLFEDIWTSSLLLRTAQAEKTLNEFLPQGSLFRKYFEEVRTGISSAPLDRIK